MVWKLFDQKIHFKSQKKVLSAAIKEVTIVPTLSFYLRRRPGGCYINSSKDISSSCFFLKYFSASAFNSLFQQTNKQTTHVKSIVHNSITLTSKKPYTLAGFEPGSSVPDADAMSTRLQKILH
jgi:hypothetical protein